MKASDLHLLELLDLHPERGTIQFRDRRMLVWDADAFGSLRKELIAHVGVERARSILRRFGFANGYRDALTTREMFAWDSDREWWLACPALQRNQGKVRATPQHLVIDREAGTFEVEVIWHESYEAAQHKRVYGASAETACWTLAGYASGFSTACLGQEVFVVEHECAAQGGGDRCRVVGKTRRAWGELGERYARDYEVRPLSDELEQLEATLREQATRLRRRERELDKLHAKEQGDHRGVIAKSREMERVLQLAETVARVDATVLITGESGVGKERVARYIHQESPRADGPFIAVNCGALPEQLLESELFGHLRGAFTGAEANKQGLFEAARGGTIFLDEIGETSAATQVKLLRVLQEREVRPVGATETRSTDVRVLAATNRNLDELVAAGSFRKDLYYRLKVIAVEIPPLRQRRDDILELARASAARIGHTYGRGQLTLTPDAAEALINYPWPGNVRELENAIERAVVLTENGTKLTRDRLPAEVRGASESSLAVLPNEVLPVAELERRYIIGVLERFDGNRTHAARALGIGANTLWRKLKIWGVPPARE